MASEAFLHAFSVAINEEEATDSDENGDASTACLPNGNAGKVNEAFELITFDASEAKQHEASRRARDGHRPPNSTTQEDKNQWCLEQLERKTCNLFSPTEDQDICGCGKKKVYHLTSFDGHAEKWNSTLHTGKTQTDSFGDLVFNDDRGVIGFAKYARLCDDTPMEVVFMLLRHVWDLKLPKLLISLVGGNDATVLSRDVDAALRRSLAKIFRTVDTWLVTNGANTGLAKLGAEVFSQQTDQNRANRNACFGIMPWGCVTERPILRNKGSSLHYKVNSETSLNVDHTHYLLVDNGQRNIFNTEIHFRAQLEKFLSNSKTRPVPSVLILCNGGLAAIDTVHQCITAYPKLPLIVIKGSGRAADIFAKAFYMCSKNTYLQRTQAKLRLLTAIQYEIKQAYGLSIRSIELTRAAAKVKECIEDHSDMIVIHDIQSESLFGIHQSVLQASQVSCLDDVGGQQSFYRLQLAILWDEVDIARRRLLNINYSTIYQNKAMKRALLTNRVPFVKLLLENGFDLHAFLSSNTLEKLYAKRIKLKSPLILLLTREEIYKAHTYKCLSMEVIDRILMDLMEEDYINCYSEPEHNCDIGRKTITPYQELMIWSALNNMNDMAELFWMSNTHNHMASALVVGRIFKQLSRLSIYKEFKGELIANANTFLTFAMDLLTECSKVNENLAKLVLRAPIPLWAHRDCLTIASNVNFRKFLVHLVCQHVMNDIYHGLATQPKETEELEPLIGRHLTRHRRLLRISSEVKKLKKPDFRRVMSRDVDYKSQSSQTYRQSHSLEPYGLPSPAARLSQANALEFAGYSPPSQRKHQNHLYLSSKNSYQETPLPERQMKSPRFDVDLTGHNVEEGNCCDIFRNLMLWTFNYFCIVPKGKMIIHVLLYLVFVSIFTYVVLRGHSDNRSALEFVCLVFVFAFTLDELRQWIEVRKPSKWAKLVIYLRDFWNILDWSSILLFYIGFGFRTYGKDLKEIGMVIYAIDIIFYYIKICQFYRMSSVLGPYVVMIYRMLRHVVAFFSVMLIGMLAYGVFQSSVIFHDSTSDIWILFKTLFRPYILLYGEVSANLDANGNSVFTTTSTVERYREILVLIALALYLVFANILLLNLIIAVFNNIYQDVKNHSDEIWMTEKFNLIIEIDRRPMLPIPFSIFENIYRLIEVSCCKKVGHPVIEEELGKEIEEFEERCLRSYLDKDTTEEQMSGTDKLLQEIRDRQDDLDSKLDSIKLLIKDGKKPVSNGRMAFYT